MTRFSSHTFLATTITNDPSDLKINIHRLGEHVVHIYFRVVLSEQQLKERNSGGDAPSAAPILSSFPQSRFSGSKRKKEIICFTASSQKNANTDTIIQSLQVTKRSHFLFVLDSLWCVSLCELRPAQSFWASCFQFASVFGARAVSLRASSAKQSLSHPESSSSDNRAGLSSPLSCNMPKTIMNVRWVHGSVFRPVFSFQPESSRSPTCSRPDGSSLCQHSPVEVNGVQLLRQQLPLVVLLLQDLLPFLMLLCLLRLPQEGQALLQLHQGHLSQQLMACRLTWDNRFPVTQEVYVNVYLKCLTASMRFPSLTSVLSKSFTLT